MDYLPCIEIEPTKTANASVIWLHGLGASGHDFAPIVPQLKFPDDTNVRFIFPHASEIPVTINMGYRMPAWYDILELAIERSIDEQGLMQSADDIKKLIDREIDRGIDSSRIILAGFSQGGAVAYQTALSYDKPLAGLLVMSSYFATSKTVELHDHNRQLPIHVYHGTADPVVAELLGRRAVRALQDMGYQPAYTTYPSAHTVIPEQIDDIGVYLAKLLSSH